MPTPCAGSRSPDAARGSRARAPLCARAPLLHRTADPGHAQPAAPSGAVSRPSSRSSRQSSGSPTIGKCARLGGPGPSEPREHGPQGNTGELASSWLHPLKSRSLRKTRYGSQGYATLGQIGFAERMDYTAIGTVCNLAARLCDEAKDGQILVSRRVAVAVEEDAKLEEIGEVALKGLSQAVAVYNVVQ